jgi:Rieske Fe-S protein
VKAATTDPPPRAYRVALTDAPALARTGGVHRVQTDGFNFSIVRRSATEFIALSNTCTHQACVVQHIEGEFVCPCHRSHFDLEGTPTRGPATAPLERYRVQFSDGVVEVALAP